MELHNKEKTLQPEYMLAQRKRTRILVKRKVFIKAGSSSGPVRFDNESNN